MRAASHSSHLRSLLIQLLIGAPSPVNCCADLGNIVAHGIGAALYEKVKATSLALYSFGHERAKQAGMILADTKFEFGTDAAGNLFLIDEVLTPDSSRFWPVDQYQVGISPPSFDKQFVRDYLESLDWDKTPPAPHLPEEVIRKTAMKYQEAEARLTGV